MKNCKVILLLFVATMMTMPAFAQKSTKKVAKETAEAVSKMDEKQQLQILNYTRSLKKVDTKKEMAKAMKKMSATDQQKVLDYISKVSKTAEARSANPVVKPKIKTKNPKIKQNIPAIEQPKGPLTEIEMLDKTFDFGTIPQGEKASYVYKVKNIGKNPLVISHAKGSCGCTVPSWPKEAIAPGDIAEIKVVFNSRGKKGKQNKRITITANTDPAQNFMTITGNVEVTAPANKKAPVIQNQ